MRASLPRPLCLGLFLLFSLLLCGLNTAATAQSGSVPVANSSFEAPIISSIVEAENGYTMAQAGANPIWTISDYAGIGLAEYFNKDAAGRGQVAPDGSQVGYVQSYYGIGSFISQSLSGLQSGQIYYVIVAAAQAGGNTGGAALPVQVSLGAQSYTFTPSGTQYRDYTLGPFMGTAGSQTLRFATVTQSTSVNAVAMLDNVRVVPASSVFAAAPGVSVPNFSFEAPTISSYDEADNGYTMRQAGAKPVWSISDYAGIGLAEYFNKDAPSRGQLAPDGSQVGYLQSYYGIGSSISQTVPGFQPGQGYYLIVAAAQDGYNTGGTLLPVTVTFGGQTFLFTPSGTQYQDYTFGPVTATAASQSVGFATVTQSTSVNAVAMLDNVRVVLSAAPFTPAGLSLYPATVTGGSSSLGTVTLSSYAPPAGVVVTLASSSPAATVPASVTVPGGQRSATFTVSTTEVNAASTATISAAAGGVTQTATLTITQYLSLTAAATGSNKVTLYWNGITGASGYNVYRGTVSGGPYSQVAANVTTADPGPGMTGSFMYSDTAGLTSGTEYFYIVRAVQGGGETVQSNEASDTPQAGAIPWDTGDPVQILNAETAQLNAVLPPDIDPDLGDFIPAEVGLLTVQGPNGVIYESADTEGDPVASYGSPGSFDSANNQIVLNDGTTIPVPSANSASSLGAKRVVKSNYFLTPFAFPVDFTQQFAYQFDPSSGIQREIVSLRGYVGLSTTELIFPSPATSPGNIRLGQSAKPPYIAKSDSADIYTGGLINGIDNTELDAGLVLASSDPAVDPAWQPVTFNYYDRHNLVTQGRPKTVTVNGQPVTGYEVVLLYGDAVMPLNMKFVTGGMNQAYLQGQVALNFRGQYRKITRNPVTRAITSSGAKLVGSVTLVSPQPQWRWRNRNSMIIKRVSSIAQNIYPGTPQAQNGSFMYGGAWGGNGSVDREGQLFRAGQGYVDWDQTPTWLAGGYPYPGRGYLSYTAHLPYHWEDHINLSTSFDGGLGAR